MATPTQIRRRGRWSLILGTIFAAVLFAAVAYADDISNSLDATVDAVAETMPLNVGGVNGTTQLYVTPRNGDGKNGCNLTGSTTLMLSVSSSNTSVATVSPSSVTFEACGDVKTLTVTPVAQGSATISVSQTSNDTGGTFNLAPATFTVNVAPPANTAPQISVAGVTGGASYNKESVPAATCQVTDAEDGNSSFAATLSVITGSYASDGIGSQTASCSYTDGGGLTAQASETYSIVDASPPVIGSTLNPASPDGSNGWYKSNVSLTWNVMEPESPNSLQKTGCVDQNITADQAATEYACTASSAGGSTGPVSVSIKRDATAPVVSGAPTTLANLAGWYNSNVVIDWTCSDATSGLAAGCPADSTISSEGQGLTASSGDVLDNAGNSFSAISGPAVNIDKTAPDAPTVSLSPVANVQGWHNAAVTATFVWAGDGGAAGAQSGEGSCTAPITVLVESLTADGTTISGTCTDKAGNTSAVTEAVVRLDLTDPTIDADAGGYVAGSWTNQTVTVTFDCFDALSGLVGTCPAPMIISSNTATEGQSVSGSVSDKAGNTATSSTIIVKVDKTKPTISGAMNPAAPDGSNSWYKSAPTFTFTCADALSGLASCVVNGSSSNSVTLGESAAAQTVAGTATDNAGNTEVASVAGLNVDLSNPTTPTWGSDGISDGGSYYFGSVPAAPPCSSSDTISGLRDCVVGGRLATVGQHTLTATATDNAGRTSTATRSYTVLAWTLSGFFQPVDMSGATTVWNSVKNGSTVPLKFEVFSGSTELTATSAVKSLSYTGVACSAGDPVDEIELTATGGTSLRYDVTAGQYVYNWQTPKKAGACYQVTMETQDGTKLVAHFKLK